MALKIAYGYLHEKRILAFAGSYSIISQVDTDPTGEGPGWFIIANGEWFSCEDEADARELSLLSENEVEDQMWARYLEGERARIDQ